MEYDNDPGPWLAVAAAVVEKAVRDLTSSVPKTRRDARAWWLLPDNPERRRWCSAAGIDEDAVVERLIARGLLDVEADDE